MAPQDDSERGRDHRRRRTAALPWQRGVVGGVPGGVPGGTAGGVLGGIGGGPPPPPPPPPPVKEVKPTNTEPLRVGGNVQAANLIKKVTPVYPPLAKQARIQGAVRFTAIIGKDGTIQNLTVGQRPSAAGSSRRPKR